MSRRTFDQLVVGILFIVIAVVGLVIVLTPPRAGVDAPPNPTPVTNYQLPTR